MSSGSDDRFFDPAPRIHASAQIKNCRIGRYCVVGERTILRDVTLGAFSYFERQGEAIYADIGKFCSIAANTRINALEHPVERVTSHKLSYRPNEFFRYQGIDQQWRTYRSKKRVDIGHDVWIGHGAVVLPGVRIGSGSVIGANAVVSRDVPPYTIVAGVPARKLRLRFAEPIAERLLALSWWDWDEGRIYDAIADMQKLGVEAFLLKWE